MRKLQLKFAKKCWLYGILTVVCCAFGVKAQSTNSEFPTPLTSNEISGRIAARDIGDARLTSYYYVFNGTQGDVFINVNASNLNGDIDIFAADGLRPLSKIRLFADASPTETGRIVYLRQPLKLILRVEGRTPDDNPASFTIKFAGSFAAMENTEQTAPDAPKIESEQRGSVRVNSVGTIIEDKKPEKTAKPSESVETAQAKENPAAKKDRETEPANSEESAKSKVIAGDTGDTDNKADVKSVVKPKEPITRSRKTARPAAAKKKTESAKTETEKTDTTLPKTETKTPTADPLENVRLVVLMKNGEKIEYPMTEVFRFSLNSNVLTVILKSGKIERRSILEIQRFSVE